MKDLARRTRQGITWTVMGTAASNVARVGVFAALGRILEKREFGIVAAAMTVIQLGNTIRDLGVGVALIQRKELDEEHVEAASAFSILLGLAIGGLTAIFAGPVAAFYKIPEAAPMIRLLGVLFVLRGAAVVPSNLCERHMHFRALTIADFLSYIAGSAVAVALALQGWGAWSLAWGYVVETATSLAILLYLAPPPKRFRLHRRHLRELLGFGAGQTIANFANYFANQGDYMVVGRFLGPAALGVYQRAYELMRFPATVFTNVAGTVLFSAFSKVQDDPERLGRAFRRILFASALLLLPAAAGLIILAPEVIRIVLGKGWDAAVWPFRIMAISMLFRTTYKLGGIVARSAGDVFKIATWQIVYALLVILGALVSMHWGILGVACTTSAAVAGNFFALTRLGLKKTTLTPRALVGPMFAALGYAAIVGAVAWPVAWGLRLAGAPYGIVAAVTTVAGALVFAAIVVANLRRADPDWVWLRDTVLAFRGRKRRKNSQPTGSVNAEPPRGN